MKNTRWNLVVAVLALTTAMSFARADGFDFRGFTLGTKVTPEQVTDALAICKPNSECIYPKQVNLKCGEGANNWQVCNGFVFAADVLMRTNIVIGADGQLQRIWLTFSSLSYDEILQAMKAKFGPPTTTQNGRVQNGFGAKFSQVTSTWKRKNQSVVLHKIGGALDESSIYMGTAADQISKKAGSF